MRTTPSSPARSAPRGSAPNSPAWTRKKLCAVVIEDLFPGRIALVSSFGADSAVLLHMVAQIDKTTPVLFIDTRVLFAETLAYRDELVAHLGLSNIITIGPKPARLAAEDPENFLWASNPGRCCEIRKVLPLGEALEGYDAWISGRKRFQAHTRGALALFESEGGRIKINPLAHWRRLKFETISTPSICRATRSSPKTIFRSGASLAPRRCGLAKTRARGAGAGAIKSNAGFIRCRSTPVWTSENAGIQRRWFRAR